MHAYRDVQGKGERVVIAAQKSGKASEVADKDKCGSGGETFRPKDRAEIRR